MLFNLWLVYFKKKKKKKEKGKVEIYFGFVRSASLQQLSLVFPIYSIIFYVGE